MAKILVLEDSEDSFHLIKTALEGLHTVTWAKTVQEAMALFTEQFDMALVDISLPDGDGFQFCDWIRTNKNISHIPIIFISANSSVESRITGFSIGGDDYISKPFNFVELKARIDAKLRRAERLARQRMEINSIIVDLRAQRAQIREGAELQDLDLTPIEFKILNMFLSEPDKVFSRDEILNRIWGDKVYVFPRSVDTHVSKLRAKLQNRSNSIRSVHGVGYKFITEEQAANAVS